MLHRFLPAPLLPAWLQRASALPRICTGLALGGTLLLPLPLSMANISQMQALNRELGKLCSSPPPQAFSVCRIHARLVNAL
jgi:hypothetical protein